MDSSPEYVDDDYARFVRQLVKGFHKNILDFSGMRINMNVLTRVPKLLRLQPNITKINLYDNMIMDSGLQSLLQILLSNPQIKSIDIGCNELTDGSLLCIMEIIRNSRIEKLQLGYNEFTWQANHFSKEGLSQIVSTIGETNRIISLGLPGTMSNQSKRQNSEKPFSLYVSQLLKNSSKLLSLNLSYLNFNDSDQGNLYNGFSRNRTLKYLNLKGNRFSQGTRIIEGICKMSGLIYLNLNSCGLSTPACLSLSSSLSKGWNLISLDLSDNKIGSLGVMTLFGTLAQNETLTTLNLCSNNFDSSVAPALKKFMLSNTVLASLDISKNHLSDEIAMVFAETLPSNESLTDLNLATTWITDAGAVEMAKSIVRNKSLRKIILKDNFLSTLFGFQLLDILQSNHTILWIDLSSNQVDTFAIDAVMSLCKRNRILLKESKFLPLRKELIRLSIQKSKIPNVEENLRKLDNQLNELDEFNEKLDDQIEHHRASTAVALKASKQAIKEFEGMIEEEKNSIADMQKMMEKMKKKTKKKILELQQKEEEEQKKFDKIVQDSEKVESENAEFQNRIDQQQKDISAEIESVEKMLEQVMEMTHDKENFHNWAIPEFPYSNEFSSKPKRNSRSASSVASLESRSSSLSSLSAKKNSDEKAKKPKSSEKNVIKLSSSRKSLNPKIKINRNLNNLNKVKTLNLNEFVALDNVGVDPIDNDQMDEVKINIDLEEANKKKVVVKRASSVFSARKKNVLTSSLSSKNKNNDLNLINQKRSKVPRSLIQTTKK